VFSALGIFPGSLVPRTRGIAAKTVPFLDSNGLLAVVLSAYRVIPYLPSMVPPR